MGTERRKLSGQKRPCTNCLQFQNPVFRQSRDFPPYFILVPLPQPQGQLAVTLLDFFLFIRNFHDCFLFILLLFSRSHLGGVCEKACVVTRDLLCERHCIFWECPLPSVWIKYHRSWAYKLHCSPSPSFYSIFSSWPGLFHIRVAIKCWMSSQNWMPITSVDTVVCCGNGVVFSTV